MEKAVCRDHERSSGIDESEFSRSENFNIKWFKIFRSLLLAYIIETFCGVDGPYLETFNPKGLRGLKIGVWDGPR